MPMAATLLSHHSSNPLEATPSDPRNKYYHRQLANASRLTNAMSTDELDGYYPIEEYQQHQPQISHVKIPSNSKKPTPTQDTMKYIDLDDDDDLPHEEHITMPRQTHRQEEEEELDELPRVADQYQPMEDVNSEGGYDYDATAMEEEEEEEEEMDEDEAEEYTINLKPPDEREEILAEIADLEEAVPQLNEDYRIVDRLGTGTFSSVYKAIDLHYHDKWDNSPWHGHHPPASSSYYQSAPRPEGSKVIVAIKRIYVTSNPERIRNEIAILRDCRGCRHTSQLITAFRERDQVVIIIPYTRNVDFREFYRQLPMAGIKSYLRCIFRALRDTHARRIIHRDVKPANFLFDPVTGVGTLCDFGLASRIEPGQSQGSCLHSGATTSHPHGYVLSRDHWDMQLLRKKQREARARGDGPADKVGYLAKDPRPHSKANRAGTRGFRAPEVLLKCGDQTGAIDVWAAGTILLFFLTGKFPLFQSNDDIEALMELATILGKRKMERAASLHSRMFSTNVPDVHVDGVTWQEFVERQNPDIRTPKPPDPRYYPYTYSGYYRGTPSEDVPPLTSSSPSAGRASRSPSPNIDPFSPTESLTSPATQRHIQDLENAYDFLEKVLCADSTQRMTPQEALYHDFLAHTEGEEPYVNMDDDLFFPHPPGKGPCAGLHSVNSETRKHRVKIQFEDGSSEVREIGAGEGIAIGNQPCEYHQYLLNEIETEAEAAVEVEDTELVEDLDAEAG